MRRKKAVKPGSLFAAMGEIQEEYIAQAAGKRKRRLPLYGGIAAACLAAADLVTKSCQEDGVAYGMEHFLHI